MTDCEHNVNIYNQQRLEQRRHDNKLTICINAKLITQIKKIIMTSIYKAIYIINFVMQKIDSWDEYFLSQRILWF